MDEAGRGCLAGPVVAAAVLLPQDADLPQVRDSKLLTADLREAAAEAIRAVALGCEVGIVEAQEIDRLNILRATHLAMRQAVAKLVDQTDYVLVDGRRVPGLPLAARFVIKGDRVCLSIAAASIIAKVVRDEIMVQLDQQHPGYGLAQHKGYGTREHRRALAERGPSPVHRRSFAPVAQAAEAELPLG
jgi:ribonuclease HII